MLRQCYQFRGDHLGLEEDGTRGEYFEVTQGSLTNSPEEDSFNCELKRECLYEQLEPATERSLGETQKPSMF